MTPLARTTRGCGLPSHGLLACLGMPVGYVMVDALTQGMPSYTLSISQSLQPYTLSVLFIGCDQYGSRLAESHRVIQGVEQMLIQ